MTWVSQASSGQPRIATVVLEPTDHAGVPRKLQLTSASATVLALTPGRYQLTTTAPLVIDRQAYGWNIELALFDRVNNVQLSQENAVRVEVGDVIEPAAVKARAAESITSTPSDSRKQIVALLDRWSASMEARDLKKNMSCYAPELARFFQQRDVSRAQVSAERRKLFQLYTRVRQMQLSDLELTIEQGQAVATVLKKWDLVNQDVESRGTALVSFAFARLNSGWVITSESEQLLPLEPARKANATLLQAQKPN